MKRLLAVFTLFASAASADMVTRDGANFVRLDDAPCTAATALAHIPPQFHDQFKSGHSFLNGSAFDMCWALKEESREVFIIYPDGDFGAIPLRYFGEFTWL